MSTTTTTSLEVKILNPDGTARFGNNSLRCGTALSSVVAAAPAMGLGDREPASQALSKGRAVIVISQLAGINFITSFSNGE